MVTGALTASVVLLPSLPAGASLATIRTGHGTRAVRIDASGILVTTIAELGQCRNRCAAEKAA